MDRSSSARLRASLCLVVVTACLAISASPAAAAVSGDELWRRVYDGPGDDADAPRALAVAPGGTAIYVAGIVTPSGAVKSDVGVVKYTSGGRRVWARAYGGSAQASDQAFAVVCDAAGNVYVGGVVANAGDQFLLIKYSPTGVRRWVRTWDGPGHGYDRVAALAVDADGNVYAAGMAYGGATSGTDAAMVKWTPNGKRAWAKVIVDAGNDAFTCVAVDTRRGRVYAGGYDGRSDGSNWLLTRFSLSGKGLWTSTVGDPQTYMGTNALALTPGGAVILAGYSSGGTAPTSDGRVGRWTAAGDYVWGSGYYGAAGDYDAVNDVTVDRDGNVTAVGRSTEVIGQTDAFVVSWKPDGSPRGSTFIGGAFDDEFNAVACNAAGSIYATGRLGVAGGDADFVTVKLSPSLGVRWQKTKRVSDLSTLRQGVDIAVRGGDRPGVYVTGTIATVAGGGDWLTVKYKP